MIRAIFFLVLTVCADQGSSDMGYHFKLIREMSLEDLNVYGCYQDYDHKQSTSLRPKACVLSCSNDNKSYAGVYRHTRCVCFNTVDSFNISRPQCQHCVSPCGFESLTIIKLNNTQSSEETLSILFGTVYEVQKVKLPLFKKEELTHLGSPVEAIDYHYELGEAFVLTNESIFRFPLAVNQSVNSSSSPVEMPIYANCGTFTVDWVHGHIIWPICHHLAVIQMTTLDGRDNQWTLLHLPKWHPAHVVDIVVDPYASLLFWTTHHAVMSCGLDGRNLRIVTKSLPAFVTSMAVDLDLRRIYLSGYNDNYTMIFFTDYEGRTVKTVQNRSRQEEEIFTVDVFRSQVYFLTHTPDGLTSLIYKVEWNDNSTTTTKVFSQTEELNKSFIYMKLMHPELQTVPASRVDVCTNRGCAHHCVVEQQLARCRCVRGFTLGDNDTICQEIPNGPSSVDVAVMGVVGIIFIILSAGVLMCMVDKLWSKIHPKMVLIYRKRSPQHHQNDEQDQDYKNPTWGQHTASHNHLMDD